MSTDEFGLPEDASIAAVRTLVQREGERWTHQRRSVVLALLDSSTHPTADELYALVCANDPDVSKATVYRTLAMLVAAGAARRTQMIDGPARFEIVLGRRPHHHLIDVVNHQVVEVISPELDQALDEVARRHGLTLAHSLDIFVKPLAG